MANCYPESQVNQEIESLEDLLAVESDPHENEVSVENFSGPTGPILRPIKPVPVGFPGERLTSGGGTTGAPAQGVHVQNTDGSYSFRYFKFDL